MTQTAGMYGSSRPSVELRVEPISFVLLQLHTDPQRQFVSAAAVESHTDASASFPLWFPFRAGPAESKSHQGEGFNSCQGISNQRQLRCTWTPHAFVKLRDTNILMSVIMCCWVRRVWQHINSLVIQAEAPGAVASLCSFLILHQNPPQTLTACTL